LSVPNSECRKVPNKFTTCAYRVVIENGINNEEAHGHCLLWKLSTSFNFKLISISLYIIITLILRLQHPCDPAKDKVDGWMDG